MGGRGEEGRDLYLWMIVHPKHEKGRVRMCRRFSGRKTNRKTRNLVARSYRPFEGMA